MHANFASVTALPEQEQHRLLQTGDPPERLWAAWALALRGGLSVPLLEREALPEAPSGIRCQLVVVLAGLRQREILRVLAIHETSVEVRATACRYFLRTAPSPVDEEAVAFAIDCLSSDQESILEALLGECEAGRVRLPDSPLLSLLRQPPFNGGGHLAFACLCAQPDSSDTTISSLVRALANEDDLDVRAGLAAAIPSFKWARILALTTSAQPALLARIVDVLPEKLSDDAFLWLSRSLPHLEVHPRIHRLLRLGLSDARVSMLSPGLIAALKVSFEKAAKQLGDSIESGDDELIEILKDLRRCITLLATPARPPPPPRIEGSSNKAAKQVGPKVGISTLDAPDVLALARQEGKRQGHAEGSAEAAAQAVLTVLRARGIVVHDTIQIRILAEKDPARLERWLKRAAIASLISDVLDEPI